MQYTFIHFNAIASFFFDSVFEAITKPLDYFDVQSSTFLTLPWIFWTRNYS